MTTKIRSTPPLLSQLILSKLASYSSERLSIDNYYICEALNLIIPDVESEFTIEELKTEFPEYEEAKVKLKRASELVVRAKLFYDLIEDKRFSKKMTNKELNQVQIDIRKQFMEVSSRINLLQPEIYKLFVFLIRITTLQKQTMKPEFFKVYEYKSITKPDSLQRTKEENKSNA